MNLTLALPSRRTGAGLFGLALAGVLVLNGDYSAWSAGAGNSGVDPLEIMRGVFCLDAKFRSSERDHGARFLGLDG